MSKDYQQTKEDEDYGPSKSELKRQAEKMQELGKELTELGPETIAKIPLPDVLLVEIEQYRTMRSFGAKRRQLQLIGKLMRSLDGEKVRQAIDRATGKDKAAVAALHKSERIRDNLIEEDAFLTKFVEEFPQADVLQIRQLTRNARKERDAGKPPKSARELYKIIHSFVLPPLELEIREEDGEPEEE